MLGSAEGGEVVHNGQDLRKEEGETFAPMTSLFQRLFSKSYRGAVAAEAAGDYKAAAEGYALSGMPAKVAEMHLIRARRVKPADRADVLDDALIWLKKALDHGEVPPSLTQDLGKALLEEAAHRTILAD